MSEFFDSDPVSYGDSTISEDPSLTTYSEADSYLGADDDLTPSDQTDAGPDGDLSAVEDGVTTGEDGVAGMPTELLFGSLNGPDGVTHDSWAEPYDYNHGTGTTLGTVSGREIDPWTGYEKK